MQKIYNTSKNDNNNNDNIIYSFIYHYYCDIYLFLTLTLCLFTWSPRVCSCLLLHFSSSLPPQSDIHRATRTFTAARGIKHLVHTSLPWITISNAVRISTNVNNASAEMTTNEKVVELPRCQANYDVVHVEKEIC